MILIIQCVHSEPMHVQLRLVVMLVLSSHPDDGLIAMCGLLCSSWIQMNRGTSRRSMVNPGGDTSQRSVVYSNINQV